MTRFEITAYRRPLKATKFSKPEKLDCISGQLFQGYQAEQVAPGRATPLHMKYSGRRDLMRSHVTSLDLEVPI